MDKTANKVVREITVLAYKNKQYSIRSLKNEDEDGVFGMATGYGLHGPGIESQVH